MTVCLKLAHPYPEMVIMRASQDVRSRLTAIAILGMMIVPALAAAVPAVSSPTPLLTYSEQIGDWWEDTSMDRDGDYIHDAIWIAARNNHYEYLDDDGRISVSLISIIHRLRLTNLCLNRKLAFKHNSGTG